VEDVFDKALEPAVTAAVQVVTVLTGIGAADVVAVAIAGISTWRVALPIAVIKLAATAVLIDFAAELRGMAAAVMTVAAVAITAGITIVATAADETIHHAMFVMPAMRAAIRDGQNSDDDRDASKLRHEHRELPPGNLERRTRSELTSLVRGKPTERRLRANERTMSESTTTRASRSR